MEIIRFESNAGHKIKLVDSRNYESGKHSAVNFKIEIMPMGFDSWYVFEKIGARNKRHNYSTGKLKQMLKRFHQMVKVIGDDDMFFTKFDKSKRA